MQGQTYFFNGKSTCAVLELEQDDMCCVWNHWTVRTEEVCRQRVPYGTGKNNEANSNETAQQQPVGFSWYYHISDVLHATQGEHAGHRH